MADQKPNTPAPKPAPLMRPVVEEIKPRHKKLPEQHYRVTDEHLHPIMEEKGITTPLRRVRGISKRNAERAGIELPTKE